MMNFIYPVFSQLQGSIFCICRIVFFSFLFFSWLFPYKPILRSPEVLSVRSIGMGWAYTAIANDETLLHSNPAGIGISRKLFQFNKDDSIFYFFPIKFGYSENIFHSLISGQGISRYINAVENQLSSSLEFNSLTDFVYIGDVWAISFITRGFMNIFQGEDIDKTDYQLKAFSQIKFGFKIYSFSFISDEDFHIAMATKVMYLLQIEKQLSREKINERILSILRTRIPSLQDINDILIEANNYFEGFAFGVDFGLLWEIHLGDSDHQINLGIMVEDAPTFAISIDGVTDHIMELLFPAFCGIYFDSNCQYDEDNFNGSEYTYFQVNGKFGIAYILPDYWGGFFSDTVFAFDIHRIGDSYYSFSRMYHVGFSTTIFDMTDQRTGYSYRLNLSAGISQNQFNAGYLVHLNKYQIGYNYFREKMLYTDEIIKRHVFTFAFYF